MELKEIKDKNIWENFFLECKEDKYSSCPFVSAMECKDKTFLSSWNWGEFQIKMGNKIWRLGVFNNKKLIAIALVSKIKARRGTFLLIQHGPVVIFNKKQVLEVLLEGLKKIGKEEKVVFIRMNPLWEFSKENLNILKEFKFNEAPMHANSYEATWKLDIGISEEEILRKMRKTTRYLIRQAMKNQDISIKKSSNLQDIEKYQKLNKEVSSRQKFIPFSSDYIKNEFDVFLKDNQVILFFGKHKEEIVSAALIIFWSGIGFYHQAASSSKHAKLSIPYLVMWEAIKEAKKRNCALYDFWGYIDPKKKINHPWAGPTLFKMGFGGYSREYIKTQDLPLSFKYWIIYVFEKIRNIKRFGF